MLSDRSHLVSHRHFDPLASISQLFLAQAEHRPDKTAMVEDGQRTSYGELAGRAAQIGRELVVAGVKRGDRVGLLAPRGMRTVAAQIGVLAIGAAFVPLDPGHPAGYRQEVVAEAAPAAILAHPDLVAEAEALAAGRPHLVLGDAAEPDGPGALRALVADQRGAAGPDDLAYVIYTSGSTGRPKGVMVAHRGVCRLVRDQNYADLGPDQVMLNMAAVAFDASIGEIYSACLNGGTLVVLPDATPSLDRIAEVIAQNGVTVAYITAGLFHLIAEHRPEALAPLQQVFPCGDVLSEPHVRRVRTLLPHVRLVNGYGPTENTVFTCCFPITDKSWHGGPVPIGRGLNHDRLLVLDEALRPLPHGEAGQLAVGGAGIGLGYLGRPDLTAERFVHIDADSFSGRAYLTGDLVAMCPDGVVTFHGRLDRQVKINGQRVELDAVEHLLRSDPAVEDAVAVAVRRADGTQQVAAVVKPATTASAETAAAILGRMRVKAPMAMVPARLLLRDAFPLSASGKVDRRRMAAEIEAEAAGPAPSPLSPSSAAGRVRATIRDAWAEALGPSALAGDHTFFEAGGTSLQLIALHAQLQGRLGASFDIARLFEAPRLRNLERLLGVGGADEALPDPVAARRAAMARARERRAALS